MVAKGMTSKEKKAVKGKVMETLGPEVEIIISEQSKNNQVSFPCMTIRHPERRISPNIRIDDIFALYSKGRMDIDEISEKIVAAYKSADFKTSDLEYLQNDPKKLYDKIVFRENVRADPFEGPYKSFRQIWS